MPAGDGAVLARFRESRKGIQEILFPCPGHDCPEMFASLVRSATRIRPTLCDGRLVHPVEKLANLLATELFDGDSFAPFFPLFHRGQVSVPSPLGCCPLPLSKSAPGLLSLNGPLLGKKKTVHFSK